MSYNLEEKSKIISEKTIEKNDILSNTLVLNNTGKTISINYKINDLKNDEVEKKNTGLSFINQNVKKQKYRNPSIDLIRLIGMYNIILDHFLFYGELYNKYPKFKKHLNFLHILIDWHNNGFALISGIIGYKTNRYSNLLYLWLVVFFYSFGIHFYIKHFKRNYVINYNISIDCFPVIFHRYWYFTAYFGMYLFLPLINKGISNITKNEFRLIIITTLGIFIFWKDFKNPYEDVFKMREGLSMIWLLTYYLTGAYIGKYPIYFSGIKKFIFYMICFFIYLFPSYLYIKIENNELNFGDGFFLKKIELILKGMLRNRYDSFIKISQSLIVCLILLPIRYNEYITKVICFLGPLAFGIYLIHIHPLLINNFLRHIFDDHPKDIGLISLLIISYFKTLKMFIFCVIVDYLRNMLFKALKIRKICIFLEDKIYKISC